VRRWKKWPAQLQAATGCHVFAWSRIGHGGSSPDLGARPRDYLHREACERLPALLHVAGIGPRVLIGHSDGASIATIYAGAVEDPLLLGLVQIAPHFVVEEEALDGLRALREAWSTTNLRRRLRKYHGRNTDHLFRQFTETWLEHDFRSWDITDEMGRVSVPTLLVHGGEDQYGTERQLDVARGVARCPLTTEVLPGLGHSPHLEAPEVLTPLVAEFVAELQRGPVG
jgi:pimeloyl-ACP methyl ester carboxylesterase